MSLLVKRAGILSTIQDLGRFGFRRFGVNTGGAMDHMAVRYVNLLLGNEENAAVVEMHFPAGEIVFEESCFFAIGGADMAPVLDSNTIVNWRVYRAERGSTLKFLEKRRGSRTYLAVGGGLAAERWLGSSSTNLAAGVGGYRGRRLQNGDRIKLYLFDGRSPKTNRFISNTIIPLYSSFPTLRVVTGSEFGSLKPSSRGNFETQEFTVTTRADRMGFHLNGDPILLKTTGEMLSSGVTFGTVQLLPDGHLVILMADHQTAGGYPRIAHVIARDHSTASQLEPGNKVTFRTVTLVEAEALYFEQIQDLSRLRIACRR